MSDLSYYVGNVSSLDTVVWSEGLALASSLYTSEWASNSSFTTNTTPTGTTTASRLSANGSYSGQIKETVYFFETFSVDPIDLMRFIITNDGDSNEMGWSLFDTTDDNLNVFRKIGMSFAFVDDCQVSSEESCECVFSILLAEDFTNNSDIETCNTDISYGGGSCDPDADGVAIYEAINSMRLQVNLWRSYITEGDSSSLITCPSSMKCTSDYDGDGITENRTFIRSKDNITDTVSAMISAETL